MNVIPTKIARPDTAKALTALDDLWEMLGATPSGAVFENLRHRHVVGVFPNHPKFKDIVGDLSSRWSRPPGRTPIPGNPGPNVP